MCVYDNIQMIRNTIREICDRTRRNYDDIILMAVTKTVDTDRINKAIDAGINVIGENRVQEIMQKYPVVGNKVHWHMIGHLQVNKVKYIIDKVDLIHSLDTIKLAHEINKRAAAIKKVQDVLVEINIGGEETKYGIKPEDLDVFIKSLKDFSNIRIQGIMTVAPKVDKLEDVRPYFRKMKELYDHIKQIQQSNVDIKYLSMGMTHDYTIAVEEGANIVRIGTGIFGPRSVKLETGV